MSLFKRIVRENQLRLRVCKSFWPLYYRRIFDAEFYSQQNPDVANAGRHLFWHFFRHGAKEGRAPHPLFDVQFYLRSNPDVSQASVNPLLHFLTDGAREGRDPHPFFDTSFYVRNNPEVTQLGINPLFHFILHGVQEGRDPHPYFDTAFYRRTNPDVAQTGMAPFLHYLYSGAKEGRSPHPLFGISAHALAHRDAPCTCLEDVIRQRLARAIQNSDDSLRKDIPAPELSIIILNYNKAYLTLQCVASLLEYTRGCTYEIVVVDNGSGASDLALLKTYSDQFRLVELGRNHFFGGANNIGAKIATGRLLIFMNNDIVVTPGWLPPLLSALRSYPGCGAVGPKFIYPDGTLQEAGAFINADGTSLQRGIGSDPDLAEFNSEMEVEYVSAATLLLEKEIFQRLGGFDPVWEPAYYEDVDLCLRLAGLKLATYYVPQSRIFHIANATAADQKVGLRLQTIIETNRDKFVTRWHEYLKTRDKRVLVDYVRRHETLKSGSKPGRDETGTGKS